MLCIGASIRGMATPYVRNVPNLVVTADIVRWAEGLRAPGEQRDAALLEAEADAGSVAARYRQAARAPPGACVDQPETRISPIAGHPRPHRDGADRGGSF